MKIAIIHSVSGLSAKYLAEYLTEAGHNVSIHKPHDTGRRDFRDFDKVISLGCSAPTNTKQGARLNTGVAVKQCIDKRLTFAALDRAGVKTLEWTTDFNKIPKTWDQVVVRQKADGRKAEDLAYYLLPSERGDVPKNAALYTRFHYGKYEYRVFVVGGKVVGRYYKARVGEDWEMRLQPAAGFELMDEHCIKAAKALGINYVGFDILAHNKKDFAILEANSGASMLHESAVALVELISKKG